MELNLSNPSSAGQRSHGRGDEAADENTTAGSKQNVSQTKVDKQAEQSDPVVAKTVKKPAETFRKPPPVNNARSTKKKPRNGKFHLSLPPLLDSIPPTWFAAGVFLALAYLIALWLVRPGAKLAFIRSLHRGSASDGDLDASVDVPADSPFHAALDVVRGAPNARDEIWPPKARGTYRVWANDASYSDSVILERTMQQAGWRHAARGERENLLILPTKVPGSHAGLNRTLYSLGGETRIALCPGYNGIFNKGLLRTNTRAFEVSMSFNSSTKVPWLMPPALGLPAQIEEVPQARTDYVMVRPKESARGEDTFVFRKNETEKILELVTPREKENWGAFEYVEPHLVMGRKWDFRVHVLVVGCDPLRLYIGNPDLGGVRFALRNFTMESRDGAGVHAPGSYEAKKAITGSGLPYERKNETYRLALGAMARKYLDKELFEKKIWPEVELVTLRTFVAIEPSIRQLGRHTMKFSDQCFEVMAIDFLLDSSSNLKILEVQRYPDSYYSMEGEGLAKRRTYMDALCVATGTGCGWASRGSEGHRRLGLKDRDDPLPNPLRPRLVPFEQSENDVTSLKAELAREQARASGWTGFERLWPPPPRFQYVMEEMDQTEAWGLPFYTKAVTENATFRPVDEVRRTGSEQDRIWTWL